jgi:hypothetical protein
VAPVWLVVVLPAASMLGRANGPVGTRCGRRIQKQLEKVDFYQAPKGGSHTILAAFFRMQEGALLERC